MKTHTLISSLLIISSSCLLAQTVTENFDSAPSDWTISNPTPATFLGWDNDNNAGVSAGEARATWGRSAAGNAYYADTTNVSLTYDDAFSASGTWRGTGNTVDFGGGEFVSFFNSQIGADTDDVAMLGLMINGGDLYLRAFTYDSNGNLDVILQQFMSTGLGGDTGSGTFSFDYDPTAGATSNGLISASVNFGAGPIAAGIDLTAANRTSLAGVSFDAFGLFKPNGGSTVTADGQLFIDSVTYSVPEPSAYALLAGCAALGLTMIRRRL